VQLSFDQKTGETSVLFEPCPDDRYLAFLFKVVYQEKRESGTAVPSFSAKQLMQIEAVKAPTLMILSSDCYDLVSAFLGATYRELEDRGMDTAEIMKFFFAVETWLFGEGWHGASPTIH
jgi:hypothetical protein